MKKIIVLGLLLVVLGSVGYCQVDNPYEGLWGKGTMNFEDLIGQISLIEIKQNGELNGLVFMDVLVDKQTKEYEVVPFRAEGACSEDGTFNFTLTSNQYKTCLSVRGALSLPSDTVSGVLLCDVKEKAVSYKGEIRDLKRL